MSAPICDELYVDVDWGSTGLWVRVRETDAYANIDYARFDLPPSLVERFQYWTGWFNRREPGDPDPPLDWEAFHAYGHALAIDLKRAVGDRYRVYLRQRDCQEITLPA